MFENSTTHELPYPAINTYFTDYGYRSRVFLINNLDNMVFSACFIIVIPIAGIMGRFVKVKFV
jgi:hypothetical protein